MTKSRQNQLSSLRVLVLAGGHSAEREVSLRSGHRVTAALRDRGHQVIVSDPVEESPDSILRQKFDIVFPMLHGTGGEDGALQSHLERLGIPFCGSSAASSALTFDKARTRDVLQRNGLPIAAGLAFDRIADRRCLESAAETLGYPLVVKPAAQGSSVGISLVRSAESLQSAVREAYRWGRKIIFEKYIAGREITVPVISGIVFPTIEIRPRREWFDYEAKYSDESTQYIVNPPDLPAHLNEICLKACQVCGVSGICRVDLRLDHAGNLFILEINTIPGMTDHSLVPMSAEATGLSLGELCEQQLMEVLQKYSTCNESAGSNQNAIAA
ncbi:MAG: D-alanine--D-alanine ligase [Planctomyces sp.]